MKRSLFRLATVCIAGAAILGAAPSAQGANYKTVEGTFCYKYARNVLKRVNQQREAQGLPDLAMTKALTEVAMKRAAELSVSFSHTRPNGLASEALIERKHNYGENIAFGQKTPAAVMKAWMSASLHKENILRKKCNFIGIGCFLHDGVYYWVQVFSDSAGDAEGETGSADQDVIVKVSLNRSVETTATPYVKNYKVAFYANGGKGKMAKQKMTYGKSAKLRANKFKRKGYVFKGWAKSKNGKVAYKNQKAVKNLVRNGKTVKLYAKWKKK